ncbi:hypothetical protein ALI144C_40585 [Actinosynnema sp. ALI-1.44]|nr:hypothetical protein ALI144C_40585 [Actinosynnema sp. ALI-1.44]
MRTDTAQVAIPLVDNTSRVAFGDNHWHLLALTRTGDQVQLSVDGGTPATATGLTGSVSADQADATKGLRLGSKMDGTDVMQGALDDFRLYRRALTAVELDQAATGRFPGDLPALWWGFEGQYTQAHDVASRKAGALTLSVDGNPVGGTAASGSATYGDTFVVQGFRLGAKPDGTNRLTGALDEFQIRRGTALAAHLPLNAAS